MTKTEILVISVTLLVLKLDKIIEVNNEQSWNISFKFVYLFKSINNIIFVF